MSEDNNFGPPDQGPPDQGPPDQGPPEGMPEGSPGDFSNFQMMFSSITMLKVPCASCGVNIDIVVETGVELYMLKCPNCKRGIALSNDIILSVKPEVLERLAKKAKFDTCGGVNGIDMSDRYSLFLQKSGKRKSAVSSDFIKKLHKALDSTESVEDFFKKFKNL